ncbi:MAG TPA: hypothetical protein VM029_13135, partial [Opitutaceae bacterium]|nr:hypothetical protein [Opitutaceae bacterium]
VWLACALLPLQLVTTLQSAPDFFSYANRVFVSPPQLHRVVADSSLDWGHDLPRIQQALALRPNARIVVATWPHLDFRPYGLSSPSWWSAAPETIRAADWIVISAGVLHDSAHCHTSLSRSFEPLEPDAFATPAAPMFSLQRPEVRRAVEAALAQRP